jgi:hypothetical protein
MSQTPLQPNGPSPEAGAEPTPSCVGSAPAYLTWFVSPQGSLLPMTFRKFMAMYHACVPRRRTPYRFPAQQLLVCELAHTE